MQTVPRLVLAIAVLSLSIGLPAKALVPPLVAACYLPDNKGCVPLNSYDCADRHGRWDSNPCPAPPRRP